MIRLLALDIDGVLTDGTVTLDEAGRESKRLCYRDIDAVYRFHQTGIQVVLVSGEDTSMVDVIAQRLNVRVYRAAKDKCQALLRIVEDFGVSLEEICYVGDSSRDAPALEIVGLGLAPKDSAKEAQSAARQVLSCNGGEGAVAEAVEIILETRFDKVDRIQGTG